MTPPVILFVFAGRRANMELQLRWVSRILQLHPQVRYEIWNLARDPADGEWLQTIEGERITVRDDFAGQKPGWGMHQVWDHYARHGARDAIYAKTDDDVVFCDPLRFSVLVDAAIKHPGVIVSADVVNCGSANQLHPELRTPDCGPFQVHASSRCAELAHEWFLTNWRQACNTPMGYLPQKQWVSINLIGLSHRMIAELSRTLNAAKTPPVIAGHRHGRKRMGDEGAANMLPRAIVSGVMGAHLMFAPQAVPEDTLNRWRAGYSKILTELDC